MLGRTIGNYQVTGELARGGMGAVYRGRHLTLPREVVIKVILLPAAQPALQQHLRARFLREAHIQSQLDHPHIVRVYEFFVAEENYYLIMEYVPGLSLQQLLAQQGALPVAEVLRLFQPALAALDYAHNFTYVDETGQRRVGIVHRDIKPGNMLIDGQGQLKLTDFGIAKLLGSAGLTRAGFNPGTVEYMSPEQLRGLALDARSDLYSMGVTLYEMLAGRLPFVRAANGSDAEVRRGHLELPVPPIRQWRPDLPAPIAAVVMHALRKDPQQRFASAAEFLEAVRESEKQSQRLTASTPSQGPHAPADPTLISRPLSAAPPTIQPASVLSGAATTNVTTGANMTPPANHSTTRTRPRRSPFAFMAALLLLAAIAVVGYYFYQQGSQATAPSAKPDATPQLGNVSTPLPPATVPVDAPPAHSPAPDSAEQTGAPTVSPASGSESANQPGARTIDRQLFTFTLTGCRLTGTIATCELVITNRDQDRRMVLHRSHTQLFDEEGGSYESLRTQFPNQEGETKLVAGIPAKVQAVFEGLPPHTRKIALLEISFAADSNDKVGFRNIALNNSSAPSRTPDASAAHTGVKVSQSLDAQLITFALIECRLAGSIVTCALALTNRDKDKRFLLHRSVTKITDETGNTYPCRQTQIANQEAEVRLITDVTTNARLVFEGIAPQARKLSKLEIGFAADSNGKTEFRNIPLVNGQRN